MPKRNRAASKPLAKSQAGWVRRPEPTSSSAAAPHDSAPSHAVTTAAESFAQQTLEVASDAAEASTQQDLEVASDAVQSPPQDGDAAAGACCNSCVGDTGSGPSQPPCVAVAAPGGVPVVVPVAVPAAMASSADPSSTGGEALGSPGGDVAIRSARNCLPVCPGSRIPGASLARQCSDCQDASKSYEERSTAHMDAHFRSMNEGVRRHGARILLLGAVGVGKSSVVNAAFQTDVSFDSRSMPKTQRIWHYPPSDRCPVHLYDTKGFEPLGDNEHTKQQLKQLLTERKDAESRRDLDDPNRVVERIHAVWWVIDVAGGGRFDPALKDTVEELFAGVVPIFIVMNKCDTRKQEVVECQREIEKACQWAEAVVPVVANAKSGPLMMVCRFCGSDDILVQPNKGYYRCEACGKERVPFHERGCTGLQELVQITAQSIPVLVASSYLLSQREWLCELDNRARLCVFACSGISMSLASMLVPIPDTLLFYASDFCMSLLLACHYEVCATMSPKSAAHIGASFATVSFGGLVAKVLIVHLSNTFPGLIFDTTSWDAVAAGVCTFASGSIMQELMRAVRGVAPAGEMPKEDFIRKADVRSQCQIFVEYFQQRFGTDDRSADSLGGSSSLQVVETRSQQRLGVDGDSADSRGTNGVRAESQGGSSSLQNAECRPALTDSPERKDS